MLRIKMNSGTVFYLKAVLQRGGPVTISNGRPIRDAAGEISTDKQWSRVQFSYVVSIDRTTRDYLWQLYKESDPILTTSGATNQFQFHDDEILTGWVTCTNTDIEHRVGNRIIGEEESYDVNVSIECSVSDWDTYRRTA